jgi:hypothetical protein
LQSNTEWTSARLGWCCSHQNLTRGGLASAKAAAGLELFTFVCRRMATFMSPQTEHICDDGNSRF